MIGIIAGMGPRSTAPFVEMVIDECQRQYSAKYDIDFPRMFILSQPTPFYLDRPIDHVAMKRSITDGLRVLEDAGAEFIAMPCNSAHLYFDELQASVRVPLLNIVAEALQSVPGGRATILATPLTVQSGLYQSGLAAADIGFVLEDRWQRKTIDVIAGVKAGHLQAAQDQWEALLQEVSAYGVDTVIAACTELSCLVRNQRSDVTVADSSLTLASAVVRRYLSSRTLEVGSCSLTGSTR